MADDSVDSIVTDPPYLIGFMGKGWDHKDGIAGKPDVWRECLRVLKPGGHLLSFAGARTYHRITCAIEDAGFEIRDQIMYLYGSGFPKSHSVHKATQNSIKLRYGKKTTCSCLDCGNGLSAGHDVGRSGWGDVWVHGTTCVSTKTHSGNTVIPLDEGSCFDGLRNVRIIDGQEAEGLNQVEDPLLLEGVRSCGTKAQGLRVSEIRSGVEKSSSINSIEGQGVPMLRENAGAERGCVACSPSEAIQGWGDEQSIEPSGAVRFMSSQNRVSDGPGFAIDPNRGEARRVISDDQCGWPTAVANVCTWCGYPDSDWVDSLTPLGTALKPAHEPVCVARKPLSKGNTVAANVLQWGTGAINVDGCRVDAEERPVMIRTQTVVSASSMANVSTGSTSSGETTTTGRWPANLILSDCPEVLAGFPVTAGAVGMTKHASGTNSVYGDFPRTEKSTGGAGVKDTGSAARFFKQVSPEAEDLEAARFFYCAKASKADRDAGLEGFEAKAQDAAGHKTKQCNVCGCNFRDVKTGNPSCGHDDYLWTQPAARMNSHPTVKPTALMAYLVRLVTPPGGTVLDPFMGSGSTGKACMREGFRFIGCELDPEYLEIARARIQHELDIIEAARVVAPIPQFDLFQS